MNKTTLMRWIAGPHTAAVPRAKFFRSLADLCGGRMSAIRYGLWWIYRHKGYGRWGLRMAVNLTREGI